VRKLLFISFLFTTFNLAFSQKVDLKISSLFLNYFIKYIQWPNNVNNNVIGILSDDKTYKLIAAQLQNKKIGSGKIILKRITSSSEAITCNMVYAVNPSVSKLYEFQSALSNKQIILVCDKIGSLRKGADIEIFTDEDEDNKTKFALNKASLQEKGFKLASSLVSLSD
jgi:YfiR/HmsC-like